ncbi:RNase H domain-containing protein [Trichonephila clavipes]|nr:RNase H domain-containing protein [Trichonephila clavipes]
MDSTRLDIKSKLARLGQRNQVCLQRIPSHVGVPGYEAADELAGRGCDLSNPSSSVLSHSEIHPLYRAKMNLTWRNLPAHHWYAAKSPDLSLRCRGQSLSLPVLALSLLLLLIFWTAEAFPWDNYFEIKTWFVTFLCGKAK